MRTAILATALLAALTASAAADPCVWGTNRPGSDVNPARRVAGAQQARCDMVTTQRTDAQGTVHTTRTWKFSLGDAK